MQASYAREAHAGNLGKKGNDSNAGKEGNVMVYSKGR